MKFLTTLVTVMLTLLCYSPTAFSADAIRFGVPPWPGVTVKTEIACQILETIGYPTKQLPIGPPIIYKGMVSGEVDAALGAWIPQQNPMLNPLKDKGEVEVVQTNLDTAVISLCVPKYAYDAGVKSFADLDKYADKFDHTIYNIEIGSGMQKEMEDIIENDVVGLKDWEQVNTTTPIMMQEVIKKVKEKKWVTWGCWKPHWMNLMLEMDYLEAVPGTEKFASDSKVYTIAAADFKAKHPEAYGFFKQFVVTAPMQSAWILEYGKNKRPEKDVAKEWIAANKDVVAKWLDGVKSSDGTPAMKKIEAAY